MIIVVRIKNARDQDNVVVDAERIFKDRIRLIAVVLIEGIPTMKIVISDVTPLRLVKAFAENLQARGIEYE